MRSLFDSWLGHWKISLLFFKALFSIVAAFLIGTLFAHFGLIFLSPVIMLLGPLPILVALDKPDFWRFLGRLKVFEKPSIRNLGIVAIVLLVILGFGFESIHHYISVPN